MNSTNTKLDRILDKVLKGENENVDGQIDGQIDDLPDEDSEDQDVQELQPVTYEEKPSKLVEANAGSPDYVDDYKFARSNLYGLIGRSNSALDLALRIAAMSEHPRAIEVAGQMMKNSADMSSKLLEIHEKMEKKGAKGEGQTNIQNNYYGSDNRSVKDVDSMLDDQEDE